MAKTNKEGFTDLHVLAGLGDNASNTKILAQILPKLKEK
jgi:hypothetical protein